MENANQSILQTKPLINQAWEIFKSRPFFLISVILTIYLIQYLIPEIAFYLIESQVVYYFYQILGILLIMWLNLGLIKIVLNLTKDRPVAYKDLFSQGKLILNYLLASIIYILIVTIGLILLVIPGIIWGIKFQFFSYFLVDKHLSPIEALKASSKITQGNKWNLFLLNLVCFLLILLGILLFLVGSLITYPLTILIIVLAYRKLVAAKYKDGQEKTA